METIKNVTQLLIGKNVAASLLVPYVDIVTDVNQLLDGQIVMTTPLNLVIDGSVAEPEVKFIQRSGTHLIHSDKIILNNGIRNYSIGTARDEVQQYDYVGWNGVSGELDEIPQNIYTIRLYIYGSGNTHEFMQQDIKRGTYKSPTTPVQGDIAAGLANSLIANMSRDAEEIIRVGMVGDVAGVLTTGTTTVTQGSRFVAFSVNEAPVVGTYIRLGTTLQSWIAKVVAYDAVNFVAEVNVPYDSTSEVKPIGAAETGVVPVNFGVAIGGVDTISVVGKFKSGLVTWKTTIDFGDDAALTTITNDTKPDAGLGTKDKVANLEKELQSDEYQYRVFIEGAPVDRTDADIAAWGNDQGAFDMQVVDHDHVLSAAQGTPTHSPKTLEIAWEAVAGNAQAAAIVLQWETLLAAVPIPFTTQIPYLTV